MRLVEVVQKLKEEEITLRERFKVKNIGVFGSLAREEKDIHDIDIIVEFSEPIGWEIIDLIEFLEDLLKIKVDVLTRSAAESKPLLWRSIEKDILYV